MEYLTIPHINVRGANFLSAPWVLSPLPIFAAHLLVHAVDRVLAAMGLEKSDGCAYIHHDYELRADEDAYGGIYPWQDRCTDVTVGRGAEKSPAGQAITPIVTGDLTVSLIIRYKGRAPSPKVFQKLLRGRKLAGGFIDSHGIVSQSTHLFGVDDEGKRGALLRTGFGYIALDRSHELDGTVESLLSKTIYTVERNKGEGEHDNAEEGGDMEEAAGAGRGWHVPVTLGYATLTDIAEREGSRNGYPHAFAENLVGLTLLTPTNAVNTEHNIFWTGKWEEGGFCKKYTISTR